MAGSVTAGSCQSQSIVACSSQAVQTARRPGRERRAPAQSARRAASRDAADEQANSSSSDSPSSAAISSGSEWTSRDRLGHAPLLPPDDPEAARARGRWSGSSREGVAAHAPVLVADRA